MAITDTASTDAPGDVSSDTSPPPWPGAAFHDTEVAGLRMAMYARVVAIVVVIVWLFAINGLPALWWAALTLPFIASGIAQYLLARSAWHRAWQAYVFQTLDAALLAFVILFPNPFFEPRPPLPMFFRFENFLYAFILLAGAAMSYSPRLVVWTGAALAGAWSVGAVLVARLPDTRLDFADAPLEAFLADFLDPHFLSIQLRAQEAIIMLLVAGILALAVRRSRNLVLRQASDARERANLARYFPPTLVDRLADMDDPFGDVRAQPFAVLFADIVGFALMAEQATPFEVG